MQQIQCTNTTNIYLCRKKVVSNTDISFFLRDNKKESLSLIFQIFQCPINKTMGFKDIKRNIWKS